MEHTVLVSTLRHCYVCNMMTAFHLLVIDVCATDNGGCAPDAICVPDPTSPDGRTCACQLGLHTGDGIICIRKLLLWYC